MIGLDPAEVKQRVRALKAEGLGGRSQLTREIVAYWKENRPQMYQRLKGQGILWEYALVCEARHHKTIMKRIGQGVNRSDASREAAAELLMVPEDNEDE